MPIWVRFMRKYKLKQLNTQLSTINQSLKDDRLNEIDYIVLSQERDRLENDYKLLINKKRP